VNGMESGHPSELLAAYLDDELPIEDRHRVDHHLAECASCRAELEALHLLAAAVAAEPVPEPTADLAARIGAHVDRAIVTPMPARRRWFLPVSIAATIGAVGLLVAFQWRQGTFTPSAVPSPLPYAPAPVPAEKSSSADHENRTEARLQSQPPAERHAYAGGAPLAGNRPQEQPSGGEAIGQEEAKLKKNVALAPPPAPAAQAAAPADELARAKDEALRLAARDLDRKAASTAVSSMPVSSGSREAGQEPPASAQETTSFGRLYQKTILLPQGGVGVVCGDSWVDAGRLAEWAVPNAGAAARDLEVLARGLGGRGSEQPRADGVYEIDVPSGRYDELARDLRRIGVTGLDTASAPASTAPCVRQRIRLVETR